MRFIVLYPVFVLCAATLVLFAAFDDPLELLQSNWTIVPIAFVAAALANATAVGGGFLFVPLFIYGYGLPAIVALKLSLATQAFGMTAGTVGWGRTFLDPLCIAVAGTFSLAGMVLGTLFVQIPSEMIKPMFGWISLGIFVAVVLEIRFGKHVGSLRIEQRDWRLAGLAAVAFVGGLMTAWTGIAIGEVVAIYLLFAYRLRVESAIANGVCLLALNSIAGALMHTGLGGIPWHYVIFTVPGVLLGGYFGGAMGRRVEQYVEEHRALAGTVGHSPIKVLFAAIILVDGVSILVHTYFFS